MRGALGNAALVVACGAAAATGQDTDSARAAERARLWLPPVASLVLPGSGQLLIGRDRGMVYLAAEAFVLSRFLQLTHDARRGADRYRTLAIDVARRGFTTTRRDTVFEYYETMERFTSSGEFDTDPGPGLAPEDDGTTYNGSMWLLARRTFWSDPNTPPPPTSPEYQLALQFYRNHAVGPDFRWSWHGAPLEQQEFRATIRSSDDAYRRAQNQLGLLLANHLVSAIDALISSRLSAGLRRQTTLHTLWYGRRGGLLRVAIAF
ncbi:MAG: hypothetical protein ACREMW_14880 [Gemmatimonadales bacterium]